MPYEYRKMTDAERGEVLQRRREMGYPLHAPPHFAELGGRFLITAACFDHEVIMSSSLRRTDFECRLLAEMKDADVEIYAWVILPNHYHVLIGGEALSVPLGVIQHLHGSTSRAWNLQDNCMGRRVWYRCSDRLIRNDSHYLRTLNYIHFNPAKHGWCGDPYEWTWSSLWLYLESLGRDWLRDTWRAYPPDRNGAGWDDG